MSGRRGQKQRRSCLDASFCEEAEKKKMIKTDMRGKIENKKRTPQKM
jgi:hypothetical protein